MEKNRMSTWESIIHEINSKQNLTVFSLLYSQIGTRETVLKYLEILRKAKYIHIIGNSLERLRYIPTILTVQRATSIGKLFEKVPNLEQINIMSLEEEFCSGCCARAEGCLSSCIGKLEYTAKVLSEVKKFSVENPEIWNKIQ